MRQTFKSKPRLYAATVNIDGKAVRKAVFKYDPVC